MELRPDSAAEGALGVATTRLLLARALVKWYLMRRVELVLGSCSPPFARRAQEHGTVEGVGEKIWSKAGHRLGGLRQAWRQRRSLRARCQIFFEPIQLKVVFCQFTSLVRRPKAGPQRSERKGSRVRFF